MHGTNQETRERISKEGFQDLKRVLTARVSPDTGPEMKTIKRQSRWGGISGKIRQRHISCSTNRNIILGGASPVGLAL